MSEPTAFRRSPDQGMPESIRSLTGKLSRKTLPLYLSMLSDTVGGIVTVAVLGHTKTAELAAYALVIALFNPLLMVVRGSLRGSMPFAAEHEDDASTLAPLVRDSTWLAILMGVLGALFLSTLPLLAPGLGVAAPTVAALGLFPLVLAGNMVVVAIKASVTTLLVALGRNRGVLMISLVTTTSTIGSVPLLVLGVGPLPALGLIGAGAAMLLVSVVTTVLSQYLLRRHTVLRHHPVGLGAPRWGDVWQIAKVGLPTGMTLLVKFGTMSVLALAVARIGPVEAATHQLLVVVTTFAFMPPSPPRSPRYSHGPGRTGRRPDGGTAHPCGGLPDVPAGHRLQRGSSLGRRRPFGRSFVRGPVGTRRCGRARATADRSWSWPMPCSPCPAWVWSR